MKIAIIDYQMSNLFSVKHAFDYLKMDSEITSEKRIIAEADAAILPGVGAFEDAMNNLKKLDLIDPVKEFISSGKPFMGVCLGMQLLFSESEEFGKHEGLNIVKGKVKKFADDKKIIKVPQIGWNQILKCEKSWDNSPLKDVRDGEFMFFVHSYYVVPQDKSVILSETVYEDITYCSSLLSSNVFATQFHPEKSGTEGIKIYRDWLKLL
ncbi:MAG: imidazole glycerol phosphate synthase subunit HisH [Candidatus Daviesbacteria bacterium]|nr:imidazole glycerol phosphate synthase subunit HisH [Candidatus Daviesbacteria bacterium]